MTEFLNAVGPFIYGFVFGYFAYPLWTLAKKIISEARKAKEQW